MDDIDIVKLYDETAGPDSELTPEEYLFAIKLLLAQGKAYQKTAPIIAYILDPLLMSFLGKTPKRSNDPHETWINEVNMNCVIRMDPLSYPEAHKLAQVTGLNLIFSTLAKIAAAYTKAEINNQEIPGVQTIEIPDFLDMYEPHPESRTTKRKIKIDGRTKRIDEPVDGLWIAKTKTLIYEFNDAAKGIVGKKIRVPWGTYDCRTGGALAMKDIDIEKAAAAIASMQDPTDREEIIRTFFKYDEENGLVSKFNMYVFDPPLEGQESEVSRNHRASTLTAYTVAILRMFGNEGVQSHENAVVRFKMAQMTGALMVSVALVMASLSMCNVFDNVLYGMDLMNIAPKYSYS